jgi:Ca-activated chloride channel family protein
MYRKLINGNNGNNGTNKGTIKVMARGIALTLCAFVLTAPLAGCGSSHSRYDTNAARSATYAAAATTAAASTKNTSQYVAAGATTNTVAGFEAGAVAVDAEFNTAKYDSITENDFQDALRNPLSTFSIDVDTASYANLRRMIHNGSRDIPAGSVRVEEILNYFKYDYPEPNENEKFSISTELTDTPWNEDTKLLRVGVQAEDIDYAKLPPSNLVFLLDVSGSMDSPDRLQMVQSAMKMLVENLTENDVVSIVVYASQDGVILEGARGDRSEQITTAIDDLMAGGGTAGGKGLETAYELALKHYINEGTNRIIWCTDGDLNIGVTDNSSIGKMAAKYAEKGVYLSIFGVGDCNYNDSLLKEASKKGKGNYRYLDSLLEARKALVDEMGGTLVAVAKDVKIQVDFNPAYLKGYRLIGYENRLMDAQDFADDSKAAGVLGAGQRVTALYELVLNDSKMDVRGAESRYQEAANLVQSGDLLTVSVRYKEPEGEKSRLVENTVRLDEYRNLSDDQKFTCAVAMWAMLLSDSNYKGTSSYDKIVGLLEDCRLDDLRSGFYGVVKESKNLCL